MNYVRAQRLIDRGRGQAAKRLGQPYDIYRIQANGATNVLEVANKIFSGFRILRRPDRSLQNIEGTLLTAVPWETLGDFRSWLLGDLFIQADPVYGVGSTIVTFSTLEFDAFCLAFHGPVKKTMGARLDRLCRILRPLSAGVTTDGYFAADITESKPLLLANGVFSFGTPGETLTDGALIPMGFSSHVRSRGDLFDVPTSTGESVYLLYIPPLNGYLPREGDRIVSQDGSRYIITNPFEQEAGYVGYQITVMRQVAQP